MTHLSVRDKAALSLSNNINKNATSKIYMHSYVYCSITSNIQDVEAI